MIEYTIFIVDDEETIRSGLSMALEDDYTVETFSNAETAIKALEEQPPDLILLDIGLPGMNGVEALAKIKHLQPDILILMITAYEDIDTVISAMRLGAYDYVVKPIQMNGLRVTIGNALETIRLKKEVRVLQEQFLKENLPCFIGASNAIQDVMEFMGQVAQSPDTPVLIEGETGTGKEWIANAIHYRSPNFKGPLATVNCAAIPENLIESELFGYEKGAFSGASKAGKKGLIEEAANGTLFLDEVGDLSPEAQAKLLRFLETGELYRVGGTKKYHIQARVVSATNKDIEKMIAKDLFRKDLYFRLGVIKVQVPSLNERRDDILPIANYFLVEFNRKFDRNFSKFSSQTEKELMGHHWTGNVRELKNMIERGVLIGKESELTPEDLGLKTVVQSVESKQGYKKFEFPPIPPAGIDLSEIEKDLGRFYIEEALKLAQGNESKAAKLLKINHHTYRYRRKKLQQK